jgi:hypothetical protein
MNNQSLTTNYSQSDDAAPTFTCLIKALHFHRRFNEQRRIGNAKLHEQATTVKFNGFGADKQLVGHLLGSQALRNKG